VCTRRHRLLLLLALVLGLGMTARGQQAPGGSVRGTTWDKDFGTPLSGVAVLVVETGQRTLSTEQGLFVLPGVPAGRYTLVFSREGYTRLVLADVTVNAGQLTDVEASLPGEFTEMEEFVVQDLLQLGTGTEAALLGLRFESAALLDSIGADLISRAGASDAAGALTLVSGATVQDGKFAVIRGLPDRYVSSQVNGVRLPSADEDTRAVELDQFPVAVIESIQVSKTFTPDQQGDASGGAVDVRLKTIPDETIFEVKTQVSANSQVYGEDEFLTSKGGGLHYFGKQSGKGIQYDNIGESWTGAVGTDTEDAPQDYKLSVTAGGQMELDNGWTAGGLASVFYERDSSYYDDGQFDSWWVENPGDPLTPKTSQGTPTDGDFKTALFDVTQGVQSENWGGLGALGLKNDSNELGLTYLWSQTTEDKSTLAIDTRGKEFFFPGYDPDDPSDPGNQPGALNAAPYLRTETLEYTQRTTSTLQLNGRHTLEAEGFSLGPFTFGRPEVDWTLSDNHANLDQPDKRQFGALWLPESLNPGFPPFVPPFNTPETWLPYKPGANFNFGNLQRIFKEIDESSRQGALDVKLPFTQWEGHEGYLKLGAFDDQVDRSFDQDTFSNFGDSGAFFLGDFVDDPWSEVFPSEDHPITESLQDVDYEGDQHIKATYGMLDLPLTSKLNVIGGARFESTEIGIVNDPEQDAVWFPPGSPVPVELNPGDADVDFQQDDVLPSLGLVYRMTDELTLRASYSETVARQTFKELSPIVQQEFLGGPVFVGNPDLQMSALQNDDLRLDWVPQAGDLVSVSWFNKDIDDPIEYVQNADLDFTTSVNYPEGNLNGFELELRHALGNTWEDLTGLSMGVNATFIDSEVTLPADEAAGFADPSIDVPITKRDATGAPEHLYNLYVTYDVEHTGTQFAIFYTVKGDTLVAGAGEANGNFVPSIYEKEYGTLNLSISQQLSERSRLQFQAKNLTNPAIEEVYRSDSIDGDVTRSSYTKGREFSLGLTVRF
jgi:outer membrane receptor protein involved in Fe transport